MRKRFLIYISFLFILPFSVSANGEELKKLRNQFYNASFERITVDEYKASIDKLRTLEQPILLGYESMYFMLISRESWNPYSKYSNFLRGKDLLEEAIQMEPNNVELIYLRYCIQRTLPKILNYSNNLENDRLFILKRWSLIDDADLKQKIKDYFIENRLEDIVKFKS